MTSDERKDNCRLLTKQRPEPGERPNWLRRVVQLGFVVFSLPSVPKFCAFPYRAGRTADVTGAKCRTMSLLRAVISRVEIFPAKSLQEH